MAQYIEVDFSSNKDKSRMDCMREWVLQEVIGSGSFGSVAQACLNDDCNYVMKISNIVAPSRLRQFENDVKFSKRLSRSGLCPKFIDAWTCEDSGFMVSEKWDGSVLELIRIEPIPDSKSFIGVLPEWAFSGMVDVLTQLSGKKILHGDVKVNFNF
jgi:serine/threonine protein kinase